jgi:hypothetical protein
MVVIVKVKKILDKKTSKNFSKCEVKNARKFTRKFTSERRGKNFTPSARIRRSK